MRRVTATEAARGFADLLDEVERTGESVVIERRGKAVATIGPAPRASTWEQVEAILDRYPPDPEWLDELRALRDFVGPAQIRWPE